MYVLKGFGQHDLFANNTVGVINKIGELSPRARTYSREKGAYVDEAAKHITLVSFQSATDGVLKPVPPAFSAHVLAVLNWVYTKVLVGGPMDPDDITNGLLLEFQTTASDFQSGEVITDGRYYAPEWLSWKMKGQEENSIRIWLSDDSFQAKYDEFAIYVVPPMDRLDDFFALGAAVEATIKSRTYPQNMALVQAARNTYPETILRAETYNYVDPFDPAHLVPTNWTVLIYGAAGNNIDSIKDALTKYILANSTHSRDEWAAILPDLFKRTEFILVPMWDQYAIPNREIQAGVHSPIAELVRASTMITQVANSYPGSHINAYASVMGHPYKSLAVISIGGPENRNSKFKLREIFPDWISVSTGSGDFNRMSLSTRQWAEMLDRLIQAAETLTEFSDIMDPSMTRLTRNNYLYIVQSFENIQYLVAAKKNFTPLTN